ncbi:heterokaryon incompatibility protein-domain-containing protein [Nemania abortiva]|nr:heterokaryon incompatibility protein-domain-containing protein [Nemania abortiva]
MDLSDEEVDILATRATIPELEPFLLPDTWRADQVKDSMRYCRTCFWNGHWDDLIRRRPLLSAWDIHAVDLERSASDGNFCCAVLLALARKFSDIAKGLSRIEIWKPPSMLTVNGTRTWVEDIYLSYESEEVHAPPGVKAYLHGRYPSIDPRSEEGLAWATSQIENCVLNHDCSTIRSSYKGLPTRLIHITKNLDACDIRLIRDTTNLPQGTRYSALTHCWGKKDSPCLTTDEIIDEYSTKGISWASIPPTFRDAMQYTQRLGLEYIWIDSLCIIQKQDKPVDWEKESTRMFDYYSNAYITLGSTFAVDCDGGFFDERRIRVSRLYLFDVIFKDTKFAVYGLRLCDEGYILGILKNKTTIDSLNNPYYLFQRGWTYQERMVSPRLLFFTKNQLSFECYNGIKFQGPGLGTYPTLKRAFKLSLGDEKQKSSSISWKDLVNSFTNLQISFAEDRLPAFAAIAQQYLSHQILLRTADDEYLCGLRKSHIHSDLLWTWTFVPGAGGGLSSAYLAPSWSWASLPTPARYEIPVKEAAQKGIGKSTITIKDERLEFTEAGRFGRVLGGYIALQGPVIDCALVKRKIPNVLEHWGLRLMKDLKGPIFKLWPDYKPGHQPLMNKASANEVGVCLLQTLVSDDMLGALALHRNSESHRYYRLGICIFRVRDGDDLSHLRDTPYWSSERVFPYMRDQFQNAEQQVLEIE